MSIMQIMAISGLGLILLELLAGVQTGFDLVLVGSILVVGGLIGDVLSSVVVGLTVSIVLGIIYMFFGRGMIKRRVIILTHNTNIDRLIGKRGVVIRAVTPDTAGMMRLEDEDWRIIADEVIYEKEKAEVVSIEGVSLKVKAIGLSSAGRKKEEK